jgi:2',3'-cyclic-nucleotide 2'-phosphodiesterase (5'-nucleotidase family)
MKLKLFNILFILVFVLGTTMAVPVHNVSAAPISFTILHTNDFHGQLEASGSNPGMARVAAVVDGVRNAVGAGNVLLVDAGDEMQGSLLSNLQKGLPTIATFNAMGYAVATFGNHEFDWGQSVLTDRTTQAAYPFVTANIVVNDTGNCSTAGWTTPSFAQPFVVKTVAGVKVGFVGVTTTETPIITVASATAGLCFKDPADSILHYYDTIKSQADLIVVLSHLGFNDGGYGYGIPVYGDKTLAQKLIDAGKPVPLIIGGHSHTNMLSLTPPGAVVVGGKTTVTQAYYNGRQVGRADLTFDPVTGAVTVTWNALVVSTSGAKDATIDSLITGYASDPAYQALINQPIGYSAVDLPRNGGTIDNMMGTFVDDAIYNYLNTDGDPSNDIDIFFNNAGGIRTDWCYNGTTWVNTGCVAGTHAPALLTYGNMFTILPFGNATVVGDMTGAQILQVLNQAPLVSNGVIQPAGLKYEYYAYRDANPGPQPFAWGAFDYCVVNNVTNACDPLDMNKTYRVGTNEFLAPGGGDGYGGFKYMTNITYWGDMLNAVDAYVSAHYGDAAHAYAGPNGDGTLDERILRDGTDTMGSGSIIPITILHNNDSHGNLTKGTYVGMTQLATLIKQEELHNPGRTLLLNGGDQIQGDAMMYYFKSSYSGYAADGTPLPADEITQPMIAVMNSLHYDAMTLGNHEFNFGNQVFDGIFKQAQFPLLGANVSDDGRYGLATVGPGGEGVQPSILKDLGGIKVAILGITNHRVPNYELPSNIVGLTFSNPIVTAQNDVPALRANNDVVIALTHIGFTTNPKSVEVDTNVDTNLAADVDGIDAIIGAHSHTNPASPEAPYKFLPTIVGSPDGAPVLVTQAYRYNNTLGEVVIGVRAKAGGGYEVVSRAGQYLTVQMSTPEDPGTEVLLQPYVATINAYNNTVVGQTTVPIDTLQAFTQETNGANLQAEASVWELAQHGITDVDFHLSGAMTNKLMASGATPANPVTLKVSDMFAGMPYENSLVVLKMNGPQLKTVLERAYRNYFYYKYYANADPKYGGYSYYTTCMIDINNVGRIYYKDTAPALPDGNNVVALVINGKPVDFNDASNYYNVSTVNYLAAGSCNFNDSGVSLWPLDQIVHDTQYYVRDAVIDYIKAQGTVSPAIEGRLLFGDTVAPVITINAPTATSYLHPNFLTLDFSAVDGPDGTIPSFAAPSGVMSIQATLDDAPVTNGQKIDLYTLALGNHTLTVSATDYYGNTATQSVTFSVTATIQSLVASVNRFYSEGKIDNAGIKSSLLDKLNTAQMYLDQGQVKAAINTLNAFINAVMAQSGKHISSDAASLLITDAQWVIAYPQ